MAIFILAPDPNGVCCECTGRTSPCGEPQPGGCFLSLPFYRQGLGTAYSSAAVAQGYIDDAVSNCIGFNTSWQSATSFSVTNPSATSLVFTNNLQGTNGSFMCASVSVGEGTTISATFSISKSGISAANENAILILYVQGTSTIAYSDTETRAFNSSVFSGSLSISGIAEGTYDLEVVYIAGSPVTPVLGTMTTSFNVTLPSPATVNPVIALYDDNGTTRQLEACPKMLIPVQLGSQVGFWYPTEVAAQFVIDNSTSGCIMYFALPGGFDEYVFSASGSSSITFSQKHTQNDEFVNTHLCYSTVSCLEGATISLNWSYVTTGTGPLSSFVRIQVYSVNMETQTISKTVTATDSGTFTTNALPYTGEYLLQIAFKDGHSIGETTLSGTITSSQTMSVKQIQALWDSGLDCPSRLDC